MIENERIRQRVLHLVPLEGQKFAVGMALSVLQEAFYLRLLNPGNVKHIVNFAAETDGSVAALDRLGRVLGAKVDRVDSSLGGLEQLARLDPADLIFAHWFGPDTPNGVLFSELVRASASTLRLDGGLLITPDDITLDIVNNVCQGFGIDPLRIEWSQRANLFIQPSLFIPRASISAII